jgi:hypothetical protein
MGRCFHLKHAEKATQREQLKDKQASSKREQPLQQELIKIKRRKVSAGLRWGNKENIWFWHHRPPALPLGHNCSNPSLRLSA